jgi:hypothetical protein
MVKLAKASGLEPEDRECSRFESGWGYMNIDELEKREAELTAQLATLRREIAEAKAPPIQCYVCSIDNEFDYLTEIIVEVAPGEEGYQRVRMYRCEDHTVTLLNVLSEWGFRTHQHGTTAALEDQKCPGARNPKECKTPTGPEVLVGADRIYDDAS